MSNFIDGRSAGAVDFLPGPCARGDLLTGEYRDDLVYFVTHPCHPSVFGGETEPDAQADFFGGIRARQNIVCCLMQGPEPKYAEGEQIARAEITPPEAR